MKNKILIIHNVNIDGYSSIALLSLMHKEEKRIDLYSTNNLDSLNYAIEYATEHATEYKKVFIIGLSMNEEQSEWIYSIYSNDEIVQYNINNNNHEYVLRPWQKIVIEESSSLAIANEKGLEEYIFVRRVNSVE